MTSAEGSVPETQVDRTVLSWARTAATLAVVALLFARWAGEVGWSALLPAAVGLVAAILLTVFTRTQAPVRRRQFAGGRVSPAMPAGLGLCVVSVLLAVAGLLALILD